MTKKTRKDTCPTLRFKRENPVLYNSIMKEYAPVFDRITAIEMWQNNIPPPVCGICDVRLQVSKKMPTRCITHCKSTHDNIFTYDVFLKKYPGNYISWDGLKSINQYITIICDTHGNYDQVLSSRIAGHTCQQCYFENQIGKYRIDKIVYMTEFIRIHGTRYDYSLVKFTGAEGAIDIICSKHKIFSQQANVHLAGHGCPECSYEATSLRNSTAEWRRKCRDAIAKNLKNSKESKRSNTKPELKCKKFLEDNNIEYEHQFILHDESGDWAYDFYIKSLNLLIEVDGEYWHRQKKSFNRDRIKNRLAVKHGYKILRISDLCIEDANKLEFSLILSSDYDMNENNIRVMEARKQAVEAFDDNNIKQIKKV